MDTIPLKILALFVCALCSSYSLHAADPNDFEIINVDIGSNHTQSMPSIELPGRLLIPDNYNSSQSYPIVIFFHGKGERGNNNTSQINSHIDNLIAAAQSRDFFLYAPQLPATVGEWQHNNMLWIDHAYRGLGNVISQYNVDTSRIYVTGLSLGGGAVWRSLGFYSGVVAGSVPISAVDGGITLGASTVNEPVWAYHAANDFATGTQVTRTRAKVNQILVANGQPAVSFPLAGNDGSPYYTDGSDYLENGALRYSEYSSGGHSAATWGRAYGESWMYDWLLAQQSTNLDWQIGDAIFVDLGNRIIQNPSSTGDYWNGTSGGYHSTRETVLPFLKRTDGSRSTGMLSVVNDFFGHSNVGYASGSLFDEDLADDGWRTKNDATETANFGSLAVTGLLPGGNYDVEIYGYVDNDDGGRGRVSRYQIGTEFRDLDVYNNLTGTALFQAITADSAGSIEVKVYAKPGSGARSGSINTIQLTLVPGTGGPVNVTPVVSAGPDQSVVLPSGGTVSTTLSGAVTDDGLPSNSLTTLWTVTASPTGSSPVFADSSVAQTSVTFDVAGSYTLQLTADDSELSSGDSLIVTVTPENVSPIANAGADQTVILPQGGTVSASLSGTATDDGLPTNSLVTLWTVTASPTGSSPVINDPTATQTSVTFDVAGSYTLQLIADDGELTNSDSLLVTVDPANGGGNPAGEAIFSQDFESSSLLVDYINTTSPSIGQFDDISVSSGSGTWSVDAGKLKLVRNQVAGSSGFQRFSDLAETTFTRVEFDLSVDNTTTFQDIGNVILGNWTSAIPNSSGGSNGQKTFSLTVKARGAGKFYFRIFDGSSYMDTADIVTGSSPVKVVWYTNLSGESKTYNGANGFSHTLGNDASDLWVDDVLLLDDVARRTNYTGSSNSAFRFQSASNQPVTLGFDNFKVIDQAADPSDTLDDTLVSAGLSGVDIGVNSNGSSRVLITNDWEVVGSGSGLSGIADSFHFEHDGVQGDFSMIARVGDLQSNGSAPRAGIMVRESNAPDARMVALATTALTNYATISRTTVGGSASETIVTESYVYPDAWLMLERVGDIVIAAVSSDGQSFTQIDSVTLSGLGATVEVGVFASSGDITEIADATIDDFEINTSEAIWIQNYDSSALLADYFDPLSPSSNQFNDIAAEGDGGDWTIENGSLQLDRQGISGSNAGAGFMRYTDFSGPPSVLRIEFDVSMANNTTNMNLASFRIGNFSSTLDYSGSAPSVATTFEMSIKGGGTDSFRFQVNGLNTPGTYPANGSPVHVVWYVNASGSTQSYIGPDGASHNLDNFSNSLWVGTTLEIDNHLRFINYTGSSMTDIRFNTATGEDVTFQFDNIVISDSL